MNTIELFAGTRSFSKVAKQFHCETFTTDYEEIDGQDLGDPCMLCGSDNCSICLGCGINSHD